jgi:hypothetical protein
MKTRGIGTLFPENTKGMRLKETIQAGFKSMVSSILVLLDPRENQFRGLTDDETIENMPHQSEVQAILLGTGFRFAALPRG